MESDFQSLRRTQWLASIVLLATAVVLFGLLGRVVWIEKHVTTERALQMDKQWTAVIPITAQRREIITADGTPLAMSVRVYNLFADPAFIVDPDGKLNPLKDDDLKKAQDELVEALSPLVKKPAQELKFEIEKNVYYQEQVAPGVWQNSTRQRRFMWLAREVDEEFYNQFVALKEKFRQQSKEVMSTDGRSRVPAVRTAAAERAGVLYHALDGVGFVRSMKRVYPMGSLASSIVGVANRYEGIDGLEYQLDSLLRGIDGKMIVTKDAQRRTLMVQDQRFTPADDGKPVWLTIDAVVQGIAEQELQNAIAEHNAESGCAVVMDPYTGKILAMTCYPTFDPGRFGEASASDRQNKSIVAPYEPGSIWKPFVLAGAIDKGIVKPTDVFDCRAGSYIDPTGRLVRDTHGVGVATVADILIKSSNIGMTQIGWKMGIPNLYETVTKFGFGRRTGVELPGDQAGIVKPLSQWNKGTLTSASFGYEVAATPLQLVRAYSTFANGGYLVTPRIINAVEIAPGKVVPWTELAPTPTAPQIISGQTCETMKGIMKDVLGPRGTASNAASKMYTLFGKTGTAHVAAGSHGTEGHGYGDSNYDSSFLVGGPMNQPRLVAIVTLHKPDLSKGYYGARVAAPAAVAIMDRSLMYMQVPGDVAPVPKKK